MSLILRDIVVVNSKVLIFLSDQNIINDVFELSWPFRHIEDYFIMSLVNRSDYMCDVPFKLSYCFKISDCVQYFRVCYFGERDL